MKHGVILNPQLSHLIARLGHTDWTVVSDAGLPIPAGPERVDLSVTAGIPAFLDVLRAVLAETHVQRAVMAEEIRNRSPELHRGILKLLGDLPVEYVAHEEFKQLTERARGIVRTGEFTPFANVILESGVAF